MCSLNEEFEKVYKDRNFVEIVSLFCSICIPTWCVINM